MSQQTTAQVRVVDPILSEHARGYERPGNVGAYLFPLAPVAAYGGQVLEFDKAAFRLYNSRRAPGSATKRITLGYEGKKYAIVPSALEAQVPIEHQNDAAQVPGLDLASDSVDVVFDSLHLEHEVNCATLARDTNNYDAEHKVTLPGASRWTSPTSDPTKDISVAKNAIRESIGVRPNTVLLSATAFAACETNPSIIERLKYTGRDSVTVELLAKLWNVKTVVVGEAVVATGQNDDFGDVWGDDVIVAYVAPAASNGRRNTAKPSYGYTYVIKGHPLVRKPYWDNSTQSWVYGCNYDNTPVNSGMTAGYLIKDAGKAAA
ncbi:major capsid protein [Lysobacter sp. CA199]|uniref:major capsid protein n=1 Tax=Lysobacter sp. CA199 TaxID=3455608 RepID=UPI003F8D63F6